MVELLTCRVKTIWAKTASTSKNWWAGVLDVVCDTVFDGVRGETGLCSSGKLCKDGVVHRDWFPGENGGAGGCSSTRNSLMRKCVRSSERR